MKLLEVVNVNEFNRYTFVNLDDGKETNLVLEFCGEEETFPLLPNDVILINEKLLDKKSSNYVEPYTYELTTKHKPKQVIDLNIEDCVVINRKNKNYVFKRLYG